MNRLEYSRRFLVGGVAVLFFIILLWLFFSYGWLTIESSSGQKKDVAVFDLKNKEVQSFVFGKETKTILLKRDTYTIRVSGEDKFSLYKKPVGPLWFNELDIELRPQKASVFLGKSAQSCAQDRGDEILFSSCAPVGEGNFIESSTRGIISPTKGGLGELSSRSENSYANPTNGLLMNYKDGYLVANVEESKLMLIERETQNNSYLVIDKFKGRLDSSSVATSSQSNNFAVYDDSRKTILNFKNTSDNNPSKITLPKERLDDNLNTTLAVNKDYIYFISYDGASHRDGGVSSDVTPNIFIYNTKTNTLAGDYEIPENWLVTGLNTGYSNKTLLNIFDVNKSQEKLFLIEDKNKPSEINTVAAPPQQICWKDVGSFYYLTDAGKSVYMYSFNKQASFLVYGGLKNGFISNIWCSNSGDLYFNFDLTSNGQRTRDEDKGYYHYKLTDTNFTGTRLEGLLPLFVNVGGEGGSVLEITRGEGNIIEAKPTFFSGSDRKVPTREDATKVISQKLKGEGVDISKIKLRINF